MGLGTGAGSGSGAGTGTGAVTGTGTGTELESGLESGLDWESDLNAPAVNARLAARQRAWSSGSAASLAAGSRVGKGG